MNSVAELLQQPGKPNEEMLAIETDDEEDEDCWSLETNIAVLPENDATQYLYKSVGQSVKECLRLVSKHRPDESALFLALLLYRHYYSLDIDIRFDSLKQTLMKKDRYGQTILHWIAMTHHDRPTIVTSLLRQCPLAAAERNINGYNARDLAVLHERSQNVVEFDSWMLENVRQGRQDLMEKLVILSYESITDFLEPSVLSQKRPETNKLLHHEDDQLSSLKEIIIDLEDRKQSLFDAILVGSLCHVQHLVKDHRLIMARDFQGRGCLHIAVLCLRDKIVKFLLETFPDIIASKDHMNRTALHYASSVENNEEMVKRLLKAGANWEDKDLGGFTAQEYSTNVSEMYSNNQAIKQFAAVVDHFVSLEFSSVNRKAEIVN